VHLQEAYASLGNVPGAFPETERAVVETLALPVFPGYSRETIEQVASAVLDFYRDGTAARASRSVTATI
jgi:dTDP-4-amino-4,6-dideoxygalactose transaminase